jgi:hypothetical protein
VPCNLCRTLSTVERKPSFLPPAPLVCVACGGGERSIDAFSPLFPVVSRRLNCDNLNNSGDNGKYCGIDYILVR